MCNDVNTFSMVEPRRFHWVAEKHFLRYLIGTMDYGLNYERGDGGHMIGYTHSELDSSAVDKKITLGVVSTWVWMLCHGSV